MEAFSKTEAETGLVNTGALSFTSVTYTVTLAEAVNTLDGS